MQKNIANLFDPEEEDDNTHVMAAVPSMADYIKSVSGHVELVGPNAGNLFLITTLARFNSPTHNLFCICATFFHIDVASPRNFVKTSGNIGFEPRRKSVTENDIRAFIPVPENSDEAPQDSATTDRGARQMGSGTLGFEPRRKSATMDQLIDHNILGASRLADAPDRHASFHGVKSPDRCASSRSLRRKSATEEHFASGALGQGGAMFKDFSSNSTSTPKTLAGGAGKNDLSGPASNTQHSLVR
jgi:hypothetical protein